MKSENFDNLVAEIITRLALLSEKNTKSIRALRREFSKRLSDAQPDFVFRLSLQLLKREETVPRFLAYELVQHHREALRSLNPKKLKLLGVGIDNWGAVDTFACYLAGPAWSKLARECSRAKAGSARTIRKHAGRASGAHLSRGRIWLRRECEIAGCMPSTINS